MLDRTIPPVFHRVEEFHLPAPEQYTLPNHLPLYLLSMGSQPIIEITLIFQSGSAYELTPAAACFTAAMLLEGTIHKDSQMIAHTIDYYGSIIDIQSKKDFCSITLTTLTNYLTPMLALLRELLLESTFPEKSFKRLKNIKAQAIQLEAQKNDRVAYKKFCASIFGQKHPYGGYTTLEDVERIQLEDLDFHYKNLFFAFPTIFVSGQVTPPDLENIKEYLADLSSHKAVFIEPIGWGHIAEKIDCIGGQQLQSAIVIGKKLFGKKEADFLPMVIVMELLGGSFSSRLMQNIREDKGYTYGIHGSMTALQQNGYLAIATEVERAATALVIQEIYKEIERLHQEAVPDVELNSMKNHLLGRFLTTINDPFAIMRRLQGAYLYGWDQNYYNMFYHQVCNITAIDIKNLAQKYLSLDSFTEVIVR